MKILFYLGTLVAFALPLGFSGASFAQADAGASFASHTHGERKCPQCRATCCKLEVEQVDEDKHCWNVECETICIPRVVFPWQKSCCDPSANNGARVKTVRVLKKHTYTCPACEYSWSPLERGPVEHQTFSLVSFVSRILGH